jgi:predicted phosphodiesterase
MRILLLSDIHGNIDALDGVLARLERASWWPERTFVMGDLVDYGPAPQPVIDWARDRADAIVSGNHDYAAGTGQDCRSTPLFHELAVVTREDFRSHAGPEALSWLGQLPLTRTLDIGSDRWQLVHATLRDPLFEYVPATAPEEVWRAAIAPRRPDVSAVLVGHSHEPFIRTIDNVTILNPGSVGLPKDDDPRASFATWEDGRFTLHRIEYDTEAAVRRYEPMAIPDAAKRGLAAVIRTGSIAHLQQHR